jgi:hypothetical protein
MKDLRLVPPIPEGFQRLARGREAHPGFTWKTETTPEGLKDSRPSHPAGVRIPSRRACPRVRASHEPGLSAPIPPGCPHAGGVGAGQALMRQGNHLGRRSHPTSSEASISGVRTCRTSRSNPGWFTAATPGRTLTEPRSIRGGPWTAFSMPLRVATELGSGNQGVSEPHQG